MKEDDATILYTREQYTMAENIYNAFQEMRKAVNSINSIKRTIDDKFLYNEDYKQGFIAGIKIMSAIFMDL